MKSRGRAGLDRRRTVSAFVSPHPLSEPSDRRLSGALALGVGRGGPGAMQGPPRPPKEEKSLR